MLSITKKKGILIACYTLVLTICILLGFFIFVNYSKADVKNIPQILYFHNPNSEVVATSYVTSKQLHDYFQQSFFQYFPFLMFTICFIIFFFSAILIYGLKRLDHKHNSEIASDLEQIVNPIMATIHEPLLANEYYEINQKITAFTESQQRLHAYISHEQKNLVTLMRARLVEESNSNLLEDVEKLSRSVDDILTLAAHRDIPKTVCDLAMITAEECDSYRTIYPNLEFNFQEDREYTILGKEQWLRRLIDNLIDNAIKYGNQDKINISLDQKHNSVLLYVKDHGVGMSEKEQERIFHYGYQINALKKDGYGIGLSLVCHVCDLCDGFINVKSSKEEGSLFTLSFPVI